jgi:hypothetical protein
MRKLRFHERKLLKKVDFLQARGGPARSLRLRLASAEKPLR